MCELLDDGYEHDCLKFRCTDDFCISKHGFCGPVSDWDEEGGGSPLVS